MITIDNARHEVASNSSPNGRKTMRSGPKRHPSINEPACPMNSATFEALARILKDDFRAVPSQIRDTATLAELGLDSLGLMEFVFAVEDHFNIRIPQDRINPREAEITLGHLCEVVDQMTLQVSLGEAGIE